MEPRTLSAEDIQQGVERLATAIRELREETGHSARDWRHLGVIHPCVGYSSERIEAVTLSATRAS